MEVCPAAPALGVYWQALHRGGGGLCEGGVIGFQVLMRRSNGVHETPHMAQGPSPGDDIGGQNGDSRTGQCDDQGKMHPSKALVHRNPAR